MPPFEGTEGGAGGTRSTHAGSKVRYNFGSAAPPSHFIVLWFITEVPGLHKYEYPKSGNCSIKVKIRKNRVDFENILSDCYNVKVGTLNL